MSKFSEQFDPKPLPKEDTTLEEANDTLAIMNALATLSRLGEIDISQRAVRALDRIRLRYSALKPTKKVHCCDRHKEPT